MKISRNISAAIAAVLFSGIAAYAVSLSQPYVNDAVVSTANPMPVAIVSGGTGGGAVAGDVASGATDSGNPVKVGGVYNSTLPTFTNGQRGNIQIGTRGSVNTTLFTANSGSAITGATPSADAVATSTVGLETLALGYVYNGTTWDRLIGTAATGVTTNNATIGTTTDAACAGDNTSGCTVESRLIRIAQNITTLNTTASAAANLAAAATGGASSTGIISAASTNSTNVKNAAGNLLSLNLINTTATLYYLRLYDSSSAPTCSSATNFKYSIPVPASTTGAGIVLNFGTYGLDFANGISYCLTGGSSSTDNTSAATGVFGIIGYK